MGLLEEADVLDSSLLGLTCFPLVVYSISLQSATYIGDQFRNE